MVRANNPLYYEELTEVGTTVFWSWAADNVGGDRVGIISTPPVDGQWSIQVEIASLAYIFNTRGTDDACTSDKLMDDTRE